MLGRCRLKSKWGRVPVYAEELFRNGIERAAQRAIGQPGNRAIGRTGGWQ